MRLWSDELRHSTGSGKAIVRSQKRSGDGFPTTQGYRPLLAHVCKTIQASCLLNLYIAMSYTVIPLRLSTFPMY
jgi:hypothetical protein